MPCRAQVTWSLQVFLLSLLQVIWTTLLGFTPNSKELLTTLDLILAVSLNRWDSKMSSNSNCR